MSESICKVVDLLFLRFELEDLEAQKKYFKHFGLRLLEEQLTRFATGDPELRYCVIANASVTT